MHTEAILLALNELDEALDSRRLSRFLRDYDVRPRDIRADVNGEEKVRKGYRREDLHDAWLRYLPPAEPRAGAVCGEPFDPTLVTAGYTTHGEDGT